MNETFIVETLIPFLCSPMFWIICTCITLLVFIIAEKLNGGDKHE